MGPHDVHKCVYALCEPLARTTAIDGTSIGNEEAPLCARHDGPDSHAL